MVDLMDFIFGCVTGLTAATAIVLVALAALIEISGDKSQRRKIWPWAAATVGYFLSARLLAEPVYAFLLWFNPNNEIGAWIGGHYFDLALSIIPAFLLGAVVEGIAIGTSQTGPSSQLPTVVTPPPTQLPNIANAQPEYMVTTAVDRAGTVQNWWQARSNTKRTDATIRALANAERLASAAARAADAEAHGIEAVLRRKDSLTELYTRQELEGLFHEDRVAAAEHSLTLAQLRRDKERHELKREVLEAIHSVEAAKAFKQAKFDIGLARARARQNDAEVDSKTAEAAVMKIAAELAKLSRQQTPGVASWLDQQIALAQAAIEEGEADGQDTSAKRAELALLRRFREAAGGAV